jgi:hypothetical protein
MPLLLSCTRTDTWTVITRYPDTYGVKLENIVADVSIGCQYRIVYCLHIPSIPIVGCFDKFKYINFAIYLDIAYIYIHSKIYVSRKYKTIYNLKWMVLIAKKHLFTNAMQ